MQFLGELIGVEYLYSQTGKIFPPPAELCEDMENVDDDVGLEEEDVASEALETDEGIGDCDHDPTLTSVQTELTEDPVAPSDVRYFFLHQSGL